MIFRRIIKKPAEYFDTSSVVFVVDVNCVGSYGDSPLAEEFAYKYPSIAEEHTNLCRVGKVDTGKVYEYTDGVDTILLWTVRGAANGNVSVDRFWDSVSGLLAYMNQPRIQRELPKFHIPLIIITDKEFSSRESSYAMQDAFADYKGDISLLALKERRSKT